MKKPTPQLHIPTLALVLVLSVLLGAVGGTLAIYSSQAFQRSVVRNRDTEAICFSSDILYRSLKKTDGSDEAPQTYYFPVTAEGKSLSFQVCNYDQAKSTVYNENNIDYTINFKLCNASGASYRVVDSTGKEHNFKDDTLTLSGCRLDKGGKSSHSYIFYFDQADHNKLELQVTVTPTDLTTTKHTILSANIIPLEVSNTQGISLRYEFTDQTRTGYGPRDFAAYNLLVSLSGGQSDVLLSWDNTVLEIDPFFCQRINKDVKDVEIEGNTSTIRIPMNSEDETSTYLIQFYNKGNLSDDWPPTSWDVLKEKFTLSRDSQDTTSD